MSSSASIVHLTSLGLCSTVAQFKLATPQERARFVTSARILWVECTNTFLMRLAAQRGE